MDVTTQGDHDRNRRWINDTSVMIVLLAALVVSTAVTAGLSMAAAPSGAAWGTGLIAAVSFFALLRKVTEAMVQTTLRMRHVVMYGTMIAAVLLVVLQIAKLVYLEGGT